MDPREAYERTIKIIGEIKQIPEWIRGTDIPAEQIKRDSLQYENQPTTIARV